MSKNLSNSHLKWNVSNADVGRIDGFVSKNLKKSRSEGRGLCDHGCVLLNGKKCFDSGMILKSGDKVEVVFETDRHYKEKRRIFKTRVFSIVFEDEDIIVINKNAGFLTTPNHGEQNTALTTLNQYLKYSIYGGKEIGVIHRLDRDTSGLLVFAKNKKAADRVIAQFANQKPDREYIAIVTGKMIERSGTFESHLATDRNLNQRSLERLSKKSRGALKGELAITKFQVEKVYEDVTLVKVRLQTGKRNQIRVHFAEAGHPVIGDTRYRTDISAHQAWDKDRLALHAKSLGFEHPTTGKYLRFDSEIPPEFVRFLRWAHASGKKHSRY